MLATRNDGCEADKGDCYIYKSHFLVCLFDIYAICLILSVCVTYSAVTLFRYLTKLLGAGYTYTKKQETIIMKYKYIIIAFLSLVLSVCFAFFAACTDINQPEEPDNDTHQHDYTAKVVVVAPTCTERGYTEHFCSCGQSVKDTYTDALGHTFGDKLVYDSEKHWIQSTCGHADARKDEEFHTLKNGVCIVCRYVDPEELAQGLVYALNADGQSYTVTDAGTSTAKTYVNIPATYEGKPVTAIGERAFYARSGLVSVFVPEGVTEIGASAFDGCFNAEFILPSTLQKIGDSAFKLCSKLTAVQLPAGLTEISASAFEACDGLVSVQIPDNVMTIGAGAFRNCSKLESVTLNAGLQSIKSSAFFNCAKLSDIVIPESVTEIGDSAFYNCGFTSVKLGGGVTKIEAHTFSGCSALASVTIGSAVKSIGDGAFENCGLLNGIILPAGLVSIGNNAFSGCSALSQIEFPDSLTAIGSGAFGNCTKLTTLTIGKSLEEIGDSAFGGCASIEEIDVSSGNAKYVGAGGCIVDKETKTILNGFAKSVIPSDGSVTAIGDRAFQNVTGLANVTIPAAVTKIGTRAFSGCTGLENLTFANGTTAVGDYAFNGCTKLQSVVIPSGMAVSNSMFQACSGLKSVTISQGVTAIGNSAFQSCSSLTSVVIPQSVTSIGTDAFYGCSQLASAVILADLAEPALPQSVFSNCSNLQKIVLSVSITEIPYNAFFGNDNLREVYYMGTAEQWSGVTVGTDPLFGDPSPVAEADIYFYSAVEPDSADTEHSYWHFENDETKSGEIIVWGK